MSNSGYCDCLCPNCFEIAIADDTREGAFCLECEEAGCDGESECSVERDEDHDCVSVLSADGNGAHCQLCGETTA